MADLFGKWKEGLTRTRKATLGQIASFLGASEIKRDTWDDLEALFLQSDLGFETTQAVIGALQARVNAEGITHSADLADCIRQELRGRLDAPPPVDFTDKPSIILLVGVNGSGKTTTAAKLGKQFQNDGKTVLLVAADTYRAAAVDQLQVLGERMNLPVVAGQSGADPGAVVYDGIQSALSRKTDIVIVDTAGRLHTRYNLMEELKKVHRVVERALPGALQACWLVLDATTGQNALHQARAFKEAVNVNGVILAKLDTSARGGMAFAIKEELDLPIIYAGLGEKPEDLQPFDPGLFIDGLLAN